MDAVRVQDGQPVILKLIRVLEDPSEEHAHFFSNAPMKDDPRNHCIPLLDVLRPSALPDSSILVMRRMIPWDLWPFSRTSEAVDFLKQVFEVRLPKSL